MNHAELADLLAAHLRVAKERHIVWREVTLPGGRRSDVYAIRPWGSMRDSVIYETKVSRSDFLSEMKSGKWIESLPYCHRFYFCVPAGLVKKDEVPPGVGLLTWRERGFRVVKHAMKRECSWDNDFLISLLDRQHFHDAEVRQRRLDERVIAEENGRLRPLTWKLAQEVADAVHLKRRFEANPEAFSSSRADSSAREFMDAVERMLADTGVKGEWGDEPADVERLAKFATAMLAEADKLRRVGAYLSRLPHKLETDIEAVLAS